MKAFRLFFTLGLGLGLLQAATAEYRPWTDKQGKTIEAEYERTDDGTVYLRLRDGAKIKISLDALCEQDRNYAILQSPPRMEINVTDKVDRENIGSIGGRRNGSDIKNEAVMVSVSLKKTSNDPYEAELSLQVVLIGKTLQLDRYVILDRASSKFQFTNENKGIFTYQCKPLDVRQTSGGRRAGAEYEGYVVVVRDGRKEIVAMQASRNDFSKNAQALLNASRGTVFDRQFLLIREGKEQNQKANQRTNQE